MKRIVLATTALTGCAILAGAATSAGAAPSVGAAPSATLGNKSSTSPDLSATGQYVVFASDATNLTAGDTNGKRDIFIRDTVAGTTRLVSRGVGGARANGASYYPSVSDNGRYVAFTSDASNLVPGDTNGKRDAFRADLSTGTIIRISTSTSGAQGNGTADGARISGSGAAIAFTSTSSNLVAKDTNAVADVFLRDLTGTGAGSLRRISFMPTGDQMMAASSKVTISNNAAIVGFQGPSGVRTAIFSWSRATGRTTILDEGSSMLGVGSPMASNGGVSSAGAEYGGECYNSWVTIRATRASAGFGLSDRCGGNVNYDYDVARSGSPAAVSYTNWRIEADVLYLVDAGYELSSDPTTDPPRAWQRITAKSLAISADGSRVAYATPNGAIDQIRVWNWRTGAVTTVSVG